jgi:hypothetical protein
MRSTDHKTIFSIYRLVFNDEYFYIGVTNNLKRRITEHKREKTNYTLQAVEILETNLTEDDAYMKESNIVTSDLITNIFCLNKTIGGRRPDNKMLNKKHSASTKQKMSIVKKAQAAKGLLWSQQDDNKELLKQRFTGEKNPTKREDVKEKIRKAKLGSLNPRYKKPGTMLGKKLTDTQKSKISYQIQTPKGVFISSVEAAKHYNCSQQTIINRCKNNKYVDWIVLKKGIKYKA